MTVEPLNESREVLPWQFVYVRQAAASHRIPNLPAGHYLVTAHLFWTEPDEWREYVYIQRVRLGDKESRAVDFHPLAPPGIVRGRPVDKSGGAGAGAVVEVYPETIGFEYFNSDYQVAHADETGNFTLYLAEGKYELGVSAGEQSGGYGKL